MGTKSLADQIKKYWEDEYKRRNRATNPDSQAFMLDTSNYPSQSNPTGATWNPAEGLQNALDSVRRMAMNTYGRFTQRPEMTQDFVRNAPSGITQIGTPLSEGLIGTRTRVSGPQNLANDAKYMNPGINVDEINAKFRAQMDAVNAPDPIQAQIDAILNKDNSTPDRWVSPYSQADLNRIGAGLEAAGNNAQQQFQASQGDIASIYQEAMNRRDQIQGDLANQLASNLSNIGVSANGPAEADAVAAQQFLNQAAGQNMANDQAFNEKLGTMSQVLAAQLANAARSGLLTPKQFVQGTPNSISEADKFRLGMLQDQMNAANGTTGDTTVTETLLNNNPLVPQMIANIEDPALRDEAARLYDQFGDPNAVLAELANRQKQPRTINNPINLPLGIGAKFDPFFNEVNAARKNTYDQQVMMNAMLTDLFRQIASNWQGVPTTREIKQKSS